MSDKIDTGCFIHFFLGMAVNLSFSTDPKGNCLVVPSPLPSKPQVSEKQQLFSAVIQLL